MHKLIKISFRATTLKLDIVNFNIYGIREYEKDSMFRQNLHIYRQNIYIYIYI